MTIIPFADFTPDLAALGNEGVLQARNCLPLGRGYGKCPSLTVYPGPSALASRIIGAFSATDKSGNNYNYAANVGAANACKLSVLSGGAWADKSGNGADATPGYSVGDGEVWEFAKWGETVLASTINEPMQQIAFGGATFADAITSTRKPRFRHLAVVRDFVVGGNCDDVGNDGLAPSRVWWSGINDSANYEEGGATSQSDFQDLANGGAVQKIVSGETGTVFCETSIYLMTFVGPPTFFRFDEIETNRGVSIPGSVARAGGLTFFWDHDGFYVWTGRETFPLGNNKFDRTLLADIDPNNKHRVSATIDPTRQLYLCAYPSISATAGIPDRVLAYDWVNKKATISELSAEWLFQFLAESTTLDSPDPAELLDIDGPSLDDVSYIGRGISVGAFDSSHRLSTLTGSALTAVLDTGEKQIFPGASRTLVRGVRPLVDGAATITVQPYTRNLQTEAPAAGDIVAMNMLGNCPMRSNARYHRFRTTITGEFTAALGVEPTEVVATGGR